MADINTVIYLIIAGSILPFFLPLLSLFVIMVEKSKLAKITTIQEFKKNIKMLTTKRWFIKLKRGDDFTTTELMSRIQEKESQMNKVMRHSFTAIAIPLFGVYVSLIKVIGNYYIKVKIDYEIPLTFPKAETLTLIALSVWISVVLCLKLFVYRTNMFIKKMKELESISSYKPNGTM